MSSMRLTACALLATALLAHEHGVKILKPTKAQRQIEAARKKLEGLKKDLAAQGKYKCCVKPGCSLCIRTNGSCNCAANVKAGKGSCGECQEGWLAGRGSVKGVDKNQLAFLAAENQKVPGPESEQFPDIKSTLDILTQVKRTLVAEKRYSCCIKGGCGECAMEGNCPCAADLAGAALKSGGKKPGVCGECVDGWRSGKGAFPGLSLSEITLAAPEVDSIVMGPGGGRDSGWYSSGTSQEPRAAPMSMLQKSLGNWSFSLHGVAFGIYEAQSGQRGRDKIFSTNWFMPTASRRLGRGTLTIRSMLSLEPATVTGRYYPELFQEGETAFGLPIINGQHPHDFFMELAALYQISLGEKTVLNFYGGPRGEPALGPPSYPHRPSSSEDPIAVLGHHQQDSTHIADNVITAGITQGPVTFEVSGFHGREPGENRWGLDKGKIDSLSSRLTVTPTSRWSAQYSIGRINQREQLHPLRPSFRQTASIMYVRPFTHGHWASTALWGRTTDLSYTQQPNAPLLTSATGGTHLLGILSPVKPKHVVTAPTRIPAEVYNSYLLESTVLFKDRNWVWGRVESADRDSLLLFEMAPFTLYAAETHFTRVQAFTGGYERELPRLAAWATLGLGGQITLYNASKPLAPIYGAHPVGAQLFLRLRIGQNRL